MHPLTAILIIILQCKRKQDEAVPIVNHNTNIHDNDAVFTGPVKNAYVHPSPPTTAEAPPTTAEAPPTTAEAPPTTAEVLPYDIDINNSIFSTLFDSMFKLYKNKVVDLTKHRFSDSPSLVAKLYNHCINMMKNFKALNTEERSYLHVYLSGCINLITTSHRKTATQVIGNNALTQIIHQHQPEQYLNFNNDEWINLKLELQKEYTERKINGLRLFILKKRESVYRSLPHVSRSQSLILKVCDIFEYL
ncbi:uncharacterized protein B0P05DRAFT_342671 [Gilbertella persicaria]|uniref:uncharacterized protein n=1 Tax=Gilbertella persicaria TaxID=101096 RepID=UPI00222034AE|nr:uncharacterized protein B0P05DRAFT_342671 [Gilbertella persicaria]KAI8048147.1 hypothetical protein B0P05DRAFT_342671 [Gilbertella persicaria]